MDNSRLSRSAYCLHCSYRTWKPQRWPKPWTTASLRSLINFPSSKICIFSYLIDILSFSHRLQNLCLTLLNKIIESEFGEYKRAFRIRRLSLCHFSSDGLKYLLRSEPDSSLDADAPFGEKGNNPSHVFLRYKKFMKYIEHIEHSSSLKA